MACAGGVQRPSWQHVPGSHIKPGRANMADAVAGTSDQVGGKGAKPHFLPQGRKIPALGNN